MENFFVQSTFQQAYQYFLGIVQLKAAKSGKIYTAYNFPMQFIFRSGMIGKLLVGGQIAKDSRFKI